MDSFLRKFFALILLCSLTGFVTAQELPNEEPPDDPTIDPPLPPGSLPAFPTVLVTPAIGGQVSIIFFFTPEVGTTGAFETSSDMEAWSPVGAPALQNGTQQVYTATVDPSSEFYVRWRVQS